MKSQPNRNYVSNDVVLTPYPMAKAIVDYYRPTNCVLEPCKGKDAGGGFWRSLKEMPDLDLHWCEIDDGVNFNDWRKPVDWIITNPPWSKINSFLYSSLLLANDIVFLMTINHAFTRARMRDVEERGFAIKDIRLLEWPKEFPRSGFELGTVHWSKGWKGSTTIGRLRVDQA